MAPEQVLGNVNLCAETDIGDSRKRPLDTELDIGATKRSHHSGGNGTYNFKILVPSVAAGAIIGKGGETIAQLQKDTGAKVKMSKANDFYLGTSERVCLITGSVEGILAIHEFIMEKIKEKPDPHAKMAIDFDHKQAAEREKQVKILVPNSTAGMIIGKGGSYIKQIKEESGAYVQISQKSKDHALAERCITVIGEMENNKYACQMILSKIVEDPQSGSCLNVSYADVTGPVANFNPTGSPFANPGNVPGSSGNNNTSYNSSGNLSPSVSNNYGSPQDCTQQNGLLPFPGMGLSGPPIHANNAPQIIETIKSALYEDGYPEQAVSEITGALNILANYGMLGPGLNLLNGLNNTIPNNFEMGMSNSGSNSSVPGGLNNQGMYTSSGMHGMEPSFSSGGGMGTGPNAYGPIGSLGNGISGLGLGSGFASPSSSHTTGHMHAEAAGFDPFYKTSPTLASPSAAALPVNNNSFGLGTGLNSGSQGIETSGSPSDKQIIMDHKKSEIEVSEHIIGAILGQGGKCLVEIQRVSGANIQISKKGIFAPGTRNRIVTITGPSESVNTAQFLIQHHINEEKTKRAQSVGVQG